MMQMLMKGGMQILTDEKRVADDDNPEGYWEWEAIKKIGREPELLENARGKVVKVISMLLPALPLTHSYKVIFMVRPIEEIVASQRKMIERRGTSGADLTSAQLADGLIRHRDQILRFLQRESMNVLQVPYPSLLTDPTSICSRLIELLGAGVLPQANQMTSVIRQDLYRNRMTERA